MIRGIGTYKTNLSKAITKQHRFHKSSIRFDHLEAHVIVESKLGIFSWILRREFMILRDVFQGIRRESHILKK